ncbi:hypothetical protein [Xylocopilactobacillus apicola]|uniref:Ankyrin repeat domain-containing protein n=1 Tax=Xylocopilactobacillus apicola TaxID=2932184 RepID=A0AAU9D9X4_9LACO|nr:hypothetical protein [Xylocopilactobacillus apicola]BDR57617.1 hypothetical protein XA3_00580 [Xylocopilactobacillus apicola]
MEYFEDHKLYQLLDEPNFELIKDFLSEFGLDSVDWHGRTFMMSAVVEGKSELVEYLIN